MELVKEFLYNVEYRLNSSMTNSIRIVTGSIEGAIKVFKEGWSDNEIIKVNFVGYIYRLPYKTITVNV